MPEYVLTLLAIVAAFAAAALVVAVAHAIVHRALDTMEVASPESRKALQDRAVGLMRALRLLAFGVALLGMVVLYLFLSRTYTGTAIRAIAQDRQIMPLMGVDTKRIYIITSAIGGVLAGLAACLLVLQYDVHPFIGLTFGPITFMICVLGGLGSMVGGFIAAFVFAEIISVGGLYLELEWGYVFAFVFFIVMMFVRPQGLMGRRS